MGMLDLCQGYVFILTAGHFIIVKRTDIEQQTHVLNRSWELHSHPSDRFSIILLWNERKVWESQES